MIQHNLVLARSNLSPVHDGLKNKRDRVAARQHQKEQLDILGDIQPFGIYRRMTPEAYDSFVAATLVATKDAGILLRDYLPIDEQPKLKMNGDFGVTFLGYQAMRNALVDAVKEENLDVAELVSDLNQIETIGLDVPFSHFEWGGNDRRRLLARYTLDTVARLTLDDQRQQIDQVLDYHKIARTPLEPDHTSVIRYTPARPIILKSAGKTLERRKRRTRSTVEPRELSTHVRQEIAQIFANTFIRKGIGSIALGPLVLGTSYSRPITAPDDLKVIVNFSNEL